MKPYCWVLLVVSLSGCINTALRRDTVSLAETSMELRYREVMQNLALIDANPEALPAYTSIFAGTADLTDSIQAAPTTTWQRSQLVAKGPFVTLFSQQSLDLPASRTLKDNWQLDPTIVPEKLQAIQCACRWVLFGYQQAGPESWMLGPGPAPSPSSSETQLAARHCFFKVSDRLWPLDPSRCCWLHHAQRRSEIPRSASYWAGCRGKYIWVDAGGMQSLSEFTLIVQTIARSVYDLTLQPAASTQQVTYDSVSLGDGRTGRLTWYVDHMGTPTPGLGLSALPRKQRIDNVGNGADVKSAISAATKSP
jgi:hypothetical protein